MRRNGFFPLSEARRGQVGIRNTTMQCVSPNTGLHVVYVQIRSTDDKKLLCCNAEEGLTLLSDEEIKSTGRVGLRMWR